jgi:hypothetical protein
MACPSLLPRQPGVTLLDELLFVQGLLQRAPSTKDFAAQLFAWKGLALPKGASKVLLARSALDLYCVLGLIEPTRLDAERIASAGRWQLDHDALNRRCCVFLRERLWGMGETLSTLVGGTMITAESLARQTFHAERPAAWHLEDAQHRLILLQELRLATRSGTGYSASRLLLAVIRSAPGTPPLPDRPGQDAGQSIREIAPVMTTYPADAAIPLGRATHQLREGGPSPTQHATGEASAGSRQQPASPRRGASTARPSHTQWSHPMTEQAALFTELDLLVDLDLLHDLT